MSELYEVKLKAGWLSTYDGTGNPEIVVTMLLYYHEARGIYKQLYRLFEEGDLRIPTDDPRQTQLEISDDWSDLPTRGQTLELKDYFKKQYEALKPDGWAPVDE